MQKKTEFAFKVLSDDIVTHQISSFFEFNSKELSNLVSMNRQYYTLFNQQMQPKRLALSKLLKSFISGDQNQSDDLLKRYPEFKINLLLWYVVSGNQDKAKAILDENHKFLLERGSIIDMSGRHFNNITPFELVLWTMDVRYMAGMMLHCIPENKEGDEIRQQLLFQYYKVETKGVNYTLHGKEYNESHFSYQPLISALNNYIDNYSLLTGEKSVEYWCKKVGKEQNLLTIEGRNQYCHLKRSFYPTPDFNEEYLERNLKFYNVVTGKEEVWDSNLTGLGVNFWISGCMATRVWGTNKMSPFICSDELEAIKRLSDVRTEDLKALKERLVPSIQKSEEIQTSYQMMI